jgi:hypothetical protein
VKVIGDNIRGKGPFVNNYNKCTLCRLNYLNVVVKMCKEEMEKSV